MRVVNVFVIDTHKGPALHPKNSPGNGPALRDPRQAQAGGRGHADRRRGNRAAPAKQGRCARPPRRRHPHSRIYQNSSIPQAA